MQPGFRSTLCPIDWSRTSTSVTSHAPEACASANFATIGFPNLLPAFALAPEVGATIPPGEDRASHPQVGNTPQKTLVLPNQ